ncbi:ClpXP protease specificity-enhancing factor [Parapusillimonas granuli]|uniref:ClpXP protease specificity-enhancing factor n=1 Tax=Parapusillimonas granuli TaxID=380911 RepID=A0A853G2D5_9BURK|nr:ClpXP protease specificity-enhancing factor [Parapusillimonas granuli]MBB5216431.1 stringent starvation protein B [Parapusillimonas granuli]MEB2399845.1 ClpXP protease specificity-enhancing factor [Alcaligenaceae bacterium]NYT51498.1 ClpXP protease specificity-enhancing factor [Parapusillimonas granuli]
MQESSTKPYLIRALHEWCTDNGYTPHIVVTVDANTVVPPAHIHDGQITLNIGTLATNRLTLGNDYIEFQTRFGGVTEQIYVPVAAVSAIYARETGAGMGFDVAESQPYPGSDSDADASAPGPGPQAVPDSGSGGSSPPDGTPPKPPRLTVVK